MKAALKKIGSMICKFKGHHFQEYEVSTGYWSYDIEQAGLCKRCGFDTQRDGGITMYTVWIRFESCSGLFESKEDAEVHANKLTQEYFSLSDEDVKDYDADDWWDKRNNANILPIPIKLEENENE